MAIIKVVSKEHWDILQQYFAGEGVILIPDEFYQRLGEVARNGIGEAIRDYDFGGSPDIAVDLVTSSDHYLFFCIDKADIGDDL